MQATLKFSLKIAQLTTLLISVTCALNAQQKSEASQSPFNAAAYRVGEHLTYNVSFSQFVSAAHVELFVAARGTFFNRAGIQLRAHAATTGVVNVAVFAINNDYTTYVDAATGLPFRAQQVVRAADRTSDSASDYNQPAGISALPAQTGAGVFSGTYDLLSALYRVRALPLVDGASYLIAVRNGGDEYQAEVKVTGHQVVKTSVGSFNTIVTRLNVKALHDNNTRIYFSDDERHVPVLVTAQGQSGEIRAELVGSELVVPTKPIEAKTSPTPTTIKPDPRIPVRPPGPAGSNPSSSSSSGAGDPLPADLPFKVGEQLNYQVYLGNGGPPVGTISFAVRSRGRYFNLNGLLFSAAAQTSGAGALAFPVNDQINSYVDPTTLLPFRTELNMSEGKHRTNRSYNIDQSRGSAVSDNKERIDFLPVGTHDLISLVYAIRTFDLSPQKQSAISFMATNQPRTLLVKSQAREMIEVSGQKIAALMLTLTSPDDPQTNRLQIRMWVGDDARHLPLRFTAVTEMGPVRADLVIVPSTMQ